MTLKNSNIKIPRQNAIFFGGGYEVSQYLWALNIIHAYCVKKRIKILIFDTEIPRKVKKNKIINQILSGYELIEIDQILPFWMKNKFINQILYFIPNVINSLFL